MIWYSKEQQLKGVKKKKSKTYINKISKKRKERLSWYSEKDLFLEIWNERKHECEECWKILREAKAHNFDHIKPKWKYPELRLEKTNIKLICFSCHFKKTTGLNYKWPILD